MGDQATMAAGSGALSMALTGGMAKSAMRREEKQLTESRSRAAKEGRDLPEPRKSGEDVMLAGNIAIGPGTPYDNYISSTYGRTPTSKS